MQSSSVNLAFQDHGVDNGSGIVDAEPVQDLHLPGVRVDLDHGNFHHKPIGVRRIDPILRVRSDV